MLFRDIRLFLHTAVTAFLTILFLLAGLTGILYAVNRQEEKEAKKTTVIIVNEDNESSMGNLALKLAKSHEMVRSLFDVREAKSEEEAMQEMNAGAVATIILPKDFFQKAMNGTNEPARLILSDAYQKEKEVLETFAQVGADFFTSAQFGVFAGEEYVSELGESREIQQAYLDEVNADFIKKALIAIDEYYIEEPVSYTRNGLSKDAHYICVYAAFLLSVLGICFTKLYLTDFDTPHFLKLRACGVRNVSFLFWKMLFLFLLSVMFEVIMIVAIRRRLTLHLDLPSLGSMLLAALFATIFSGCVILITGKASAITLYVLSGIGLFLCGGIIPYSLLHKSILMIGTYSPLGVVIGFLSPLFGANISWTSVFFGGLYLILALFLCSIRMKHLVGARK